ncbi:unnamed protein product [Rhizoctonia solani]|nr:unnamed protein product [Rhizoctonia solani]
MGASHTRGRAPPVHPRCSTAAGVPQTITGLGLVGWHMTSLQRLSWVFRDGLECTRLIVFTGMCGRAYSPRFLWMWPNAKVSVMGSGQLSEVMATVSKDPAQHASLKAEIENQSTALYATARLWDDGIIRPQDTRDVVGLGLGLAARERRTGSSFAQSGAAEGAFGVFRM